MMMRLARRLRVKWTKPMPSISILLSLITGYLPSPCEKYNTFVSSPKIFAVLYQYSDCQRTLTNKINNDIIALNTYEELATREAKKAERPIFISKFRFV
jgi:hypothetical protein